ncbi:nitrogen regulatory protein P-II [Oxobacter pfennigii]|uniref:Nitrogen regulatory protein P-II n=1 Tax=Oxobacter pfennigii TaxID=36849 RepID=A0A0N8NTY4_9CLOT|nr:P-II family nitrogen regulator [Oxobacter pfennigii]KPU46120.1 nitrogen regulatory protein P-II [Oxobacter pfennigii]
MKHIKAVIKPEKLADVREALEREGCYRGVMISDIMGQGTQKGIIQAWRGEKFEMDLLPKVVIDMVVKDEDVPIIKSVLMKSARTGEIGDGKIFVYNVEEAVRIRTGEEGEAAI